MTKSNRHLGVVLIVFAFALILAGLAHYYRVSYWLAPPAEKMSITWAEDLALLNRSKKLPKEWAEIREVSVKADNSLIQDWIGSLSPPIARNPKGNYRLDAFLVFWIEGIRYGVLVQYHLIDLRNDNTVWEDGRTYKLGYVY